MTKNRWIDNCPACEEVLRQFFFKKAFIPDDPACSGWSGVEGYYCTGCDKLLMIVGFDAKDREMFWISRSASGDFTIPHAPPGRSHPCYNPQVIESKVIFFAKGFAKSRRIRAEIGPRRKPDEPRWTLAISDAQADISGIVATLGEWLINSNSGKVTSQERDSGDHLIHIEFSKKARAQYMVNRLIRKFDLINCSKLYRYNEGRRYL